VEINSKKLQPLPSPEDLIASLPLSPSGYKSVTQHRKNVEAILHNDDDRFLLIIGPCSIHNTDEAYEYFRRLQVLTTEVSDVFFIVMRTYFEKSRTSLGWPGFIADPNLTGDYDITEGLKQARKYLLTTIEEGMPVAAEFVDPLVAPYLSDLITWGAIGARNVSSSKHRTLASCLPMPIGFKNTVEGSLSSPINAVITSRLPQPHISVDKKGHIALFLSQGNPHSHIVLRGGTSGINYEESALEEAYSLLDKALITTKLIVDCGHGNATAATPQDVVLKKLVHHIVDNKDTRIGGFMLESNICEGKQDFLPESLRYGISVTDACISWETTCDVVTSMAEYIRNNKR
jgi:3-deoxy-7-phosphoheptulonate synthase